MNLATEIALWRHQVETYGELRLSRGNVRRLMKYAELGAERVPQTGDLSQPELPLFGPQPRQEIIKLIVS